MLPRFHIRRERPDGPAPQLETQVQIANDFFREQTNEVRIARQPRIVIGKNPLRSCRPADVIVLLQHEHTQPRFREIRRRHQAIVPRAQNDRVVSRLDLTNAHALAHDRTHSRSAWPRSQSKLSLGTNGPH